MEWVSLRGLLAPFSGEVLPDVDEAKGWAWAAPAALSAFFWAFVVTVCLAEVQLGGEVLGLAPGFGFFSWSLAPWELLGPLALATSRLAPAVPVPLTTGVAAEAVFPFAATLRSPGFFTVFALEVWPSPGLLAVPSPSDFMADVALREEEVACSDALWLLCTGGLSGADEGHFTALCCEKREHITIAYYTNQHIIPVNLINQTLVLSFPSKQWNNYVCNFILKIQHKHTRQAKLLFWFYQTTSWEICGSSSALSRSCLTCWQSLSGSAQLGLS